MGSLVPKRARKRCLLLWVLTGSISYYDMKLLSYTNTKGRLIGAGVSRALLANAWLSNSGAAVGRYMNAGSDAAPCTRLGSFFQTTEIQRGWDMVLH